VGVAASEGASDWLIFVPLLLLLVTGLYRVFRISLEISYISLVRPADVPTLVRDSIKFQEIFSQE
jgi:hypothetical protein